MIGLLLFQLNIRIKHLSSTKEKLFKPPFKTISYGKNSVISSSIQSWNNAQQKPGSLKTLPSAKIEQLITDEILKNYQILYSIMIS